jgi:hypothetical protein
MKNMPNREITNADRRNLLAAAGALMAGTGVLAVSEASAQTVQAPQGGQTFQLPPSIWEGSVKRAQKYLSDRQALAQYQGQLTKMLEGIKAGQNPHMLIRDVVLSEEDTLSKMAPFINVAGTENLFALCMLTVLATLATNQKPS